VTIRNNTEHPVTYTIRHIPYYGGTYNPKTQETIHLREQAAQLTLQKGEERQVGLPELYGWPPDQMYAFEGCLLVSPDRAESAKHTEAVRIALH
jgi:hypothetical protein